MRPPDPGRPAGDHPPVTLPNGPDAHRDNATVPQACYGEPGDGVQVRCADGRPCVEVSARTVAGHRVKYVEGDAAAGEALLEAARRWAEAHGRGTPVGDEMGETA